MEKPNQSSEHRNPDSEKERKHISDKQTNKKPPPSRRDRIRLYKPCHRESRRRGPRGCVPPAAAPPSRAPGRGGRAAPGTLWAGVGRRRAGWVGRLRTFTNDRRTGQCPGLCGFPLECAGVIPARPRGGAPRRWNPVPLQGCWKPHGEGRGQRKTRTRGREGRSMQCFVRLAVRCDGGSVLRQFQGGTRFS